MQVDGSSQVAAIAAIKAQIADKASDLIINAVKAGTSQAITATAGCFSLPEPETKRRR
jgi:peptide deformylase